MKKLALTVLLLAPPAAAQPVFNSSGEQRNVCKVWDGTDTAAVTAGGLLQVDGSGVTQPVSGTVTANAGSGTFVVGDGSGALTVDGTLTCNAGSGTFIVGDGAGALNVIVDSGTTAATQSGTWTVQPGNTANTTPWLVKLHDGTDAADVTAANALKVDGSAVTQPVSGTVTVTDGSGALNTIIDSGSVTVSDGSGALNVIVDSATLGDVTTVGKAADGAAVSGNPVRIAGKDGSGNTQDIITDASGELQVDVLTVPSVTIGTFPDNEPFNLNQVAGSAVATGNGTASGSIRVSLASDSTGQVAVASFPDNEPVNVAQVGGSAVAAGPCEREVNLYVQIDQTSGEQLITGTASERVYVCSISIVTATAQNIALVDGTGSVCATSPTGLLGGSTAATGWNLGANGGIVLPFSPQGYAKTSTDADNVCLLQSGGGQVSGVITYVSVPNI